MGFSVTAAFALMMIACLVAFGAVVTVLNTNLRAINVAENEQTNLKIEKSNTDFRIVSVNATNTTVSTYSLIVVLYNDGSTTLRSDKFSVLVDGVLQQNVTYNVTYFYPLSYMEFTIDGLQGTVGSTHRLEVVSGNGIAKFAEYTVS
jgi:archaellum component FlaF (FlaF/FlaG flagellin family)